MEEGHSRHQLAEDPCALGFGEELLALLFEDRLQDTALDVLEDKVELPGGVDRVVQPHYVWVTLAELAQVCLVLALVSIGQNT